LRIVKGKQYTPRALFTKVRREIHAKAPRFIPYAALFGCSDEVNSAADLERFAAFGTHGGIFTTRIIGSQVFYHQIKVALGTGHKTNVFEVNVHIGEEKDARGRVAYGHITGRDKRRRACCGALTHVLEDFRTHPREKPSVSQHVGGEVYLDFLGTLKFRLKQYRSEILSAGNPIMAITRRNLDAQVAELAVRLRNDIAEHPKDGPFFVYGTISYNHTRGADRLSLEHFLMITGPGPADVYALL